MPTFACGGALSSDAMTSIKQAGFRSIVNLRAANEEGANVEAETKSAQDAGVKYIWLPFVTASPDAAKVDDVSQGRRRTRPTSRCCSTARAAAGRRCSGRSSA